MSRRRFAADGDISVGPGAVCKRTRWRLRGPTKKSGAALGLGPDVAASDVLRPLFSDQAIVSLPCQLRRAVKKPIKPSPGRLIALGADVGRSPRTWTALVGI